MASRKSVHMMLGSGRRLMDATGGASYHVQTTVVNA